MKREGSSVWSFRRTADRSAAHSLLTLELADEARRQLGLVFPADR
ncbi:hypothetical protein [Cohnella caldifontis]|nr:hypothetical protein [Cohnella sp. YIM B05605]